MVVQPKWGVLGIMQMNRQESPEFQGSAEFAGKASSTVACR
jgi:hypothetical protein